MPAPLILPLREGLLLRAATVFAHLLPVFAVWMAGSARWVCGVVSLLVLISAWRQVRRVRRWCACRISLHESGLARLETPQRPAGDDIRILPESVDLGWLVVLVWQPVDGGVVRRAAISRDSLPADVWRGLRRWLRWQIPADAKI